MEFIAMIMCRARISLLEFTNSPCVRPIHKNSLACLTLLGGLPTLRMWVTWMFRPIMGSGARAATSARPLSQTPKGTLVRTPGMTCTDSPTADRAEFPPSPILTSCNQSYVFNATHIRAGCFTKYSSWTTLRSHRGALARGNIQG